MNLLQPDNPNFLTVDRHANRIAGILKDTVTNKQYELVKDSYIAVAKKFRVIPNSLQASLWSYYRELKFGNKYGV